VLLHGSGGDENELVPLAVDVRALTKMTTDHSKVMARRWSSA
jgi:predicted esterase